MNIMKMAFWNFRMNLRHYAPLLMSLVSAVLLLLNFLMLLYTDTFSAVGEPDAGRINGVMKAGSVVLGCFLSFYIWYFTDVILAKHKKESSICVLMGLNREQAGRLYMAETFMTGLSVLVCGIFFGMLTTQLFQMILGAVSGIEVKLTFRFASEPLFITTGVLLFPYSVFAVRGYKNIVRSSVLAMLPAARAGEQILARPKGMVCRAVFGAGILFAGYYLSGKMGGTRTADRLFLAGKIGGARAAGTLFLAGILVICGIFLTFDGLIPLLFGSMADNKRFLYRKERTLWVNNAACRMRKNCRTYAMSCVLMLCAVTVLAAGDAVKERYMAAGIVSEWCEIRWIKVLYAVAASIFLVFTMAGGSAILMKAYSDAFEEKERYGFLRKMGMDSGIFCRAITREFCAVYVCPFVITAISFYFSAGALEKLLSVDLRLFYLAGVFLLFLFFLLLYLLSVTQYRKNAGNG